VIIERPLYEHISIQRQSMAPAHDETVYEQGFESSQDSWTAGTSSSVARTSGGAHTGTWALHVRRSSGTGIAIGQRTVSGLVIGQSYTVSGFVGRSTSSVTAACFGVTGSGTGSTVTPDFDAATTPASYTFTATGTSHTVTVQANVSSSIGSHTLYVDDITIVRHVPEEPVWDDLVPDALGLLIRRGGVRDGLGVRTDVGLATFRLLDAQDPMDEGTLAPGQTVQVLCDEEPIFTGRIAHLNSRYPLNKQTGQSRTYVEVTVADAVQIHGSTMRYGVDLGEDTNETFEERIERLEASAKAPVEVPEVGGPIVRYAL